jgi:Fe-S-cluster containining protein
MAKLDVTGIPECTGCGTCCFSYAEDYLRVSGGDYERLGDDAERLVQFIENRAYLRITDGHCIALTCDSAAGTFHCSVYERRPDVCRVLERGSGHCAAERAEKAERPLLMLRRGR